MCCLNSISEKNIIRCGHRFECYGPTTSPPFENPKTKLLSTGIVPGCVLKNGGWPGQVQLLTSETGILILQDCTVSYIQERIVFERLTVLFHSDVHTAAHCVRL